MVHTTYGIVIYGDVVTTLDTNRISGKHDYAKVLLSKIGQTNLSLPDLR